MVSVFLRVFGWFCVGLNGFQSFLVVFLCSVVFLGFPVSFQNIFG